MRLTLGMLLRGEGWTVREAAGATSAVALLEQEPFDVVITDLRMDDAGGIDVLKTAKRVSPETEVVILTAFGSLGSAVEAVKLGAFDYLSKPFEPDELVVVVRKALERRALLREVDQLRDGARGRARRQSRRRQGGGDAAPLRAGASRGGLGRDDSHPGRERHRQGADRADGPCAQSPGQPPVRGRGLRDAARAAPRVRAVRACPGRVHGCDRGQEGTGRGGAGRHGVPGRDRCPPARPPRSSSIASCRSGRSGAWAAPRRSRSTSA